MKPQPAEEEHSFVSKLTEAAIPLEFANIDSALSLPRGLLRLRNMFKKHKQQICQSFLIHANFFSRLTARAAGVPVVISGIRVAEREKKWQLRLDRMTQSLVDKYVCVSKGVAEFTAKTGRIPQQKISVIPNGIETADYENVQKSNLTQFGCAPNTHKVIVISRLHQQKGIDWLLQTLPYWLELRSDCELLIVGDGPERANLEQLSAQQPYRNRVHFFGHRRDIPELLAASDLLLLPSRWEGMPNVVMQAMAAGLPIVATEVEGIEELLVQQSEIPLQTCKFGDTVAFASKINRFLDDDKLRNITGMQNQEYLRQHFKIEQMVTAYEELWLSQIEVSSWKTR
jgi:glycosyltransferase involved in cell wall biosynthesis